MALFQPPKISIQKREGKQFPDQSATGLLREMYV